MTSEERLPIMNSPMEFRDTDPTNLTSGFPCRYIAHPDSFVDNFLAIITSGAGSHRCSQEGAPAPPSHARCTIPNLQKHKSPERHIEIFITEGPDGRNTSSNFGIDIACRTFDKALTPKGLGMLGEINSASAGETRCHQSSPGT